MLWTQYDLRGCALNMANKTIGDAIYDRLEHNAYVINLCKNTEYPSMRERCGSRFKPIEWMHIGARNTWLPFHGTIGSTCGGSDDPPRRNNH